MSQVDQQAMVSLIGITLGTAPGEIAVAATAHGARLYMVPVHHFAPQAKFVRISVAVDAGVISHIVLVPLGPMEKHLFALQGEEAMETL